MKEYSAYIFDMDGTLVQSEQLKGKALSEACSHYGKNISVKFYKDVMGESWEVVTNYFFQLGEFTPNRKEFDIIFKNIYSKLIEEDLILSPNINKLLKRIISKGRRIGLVSSAPYWTVEKILNKFNLTNYFEIIVSQEDVVFHKPHPDAYLMALKKLSLPGTKVLVFEDSNAGLVAADRAKCETVAFVHEFNSKNDLSLAVKVISDFNEIEI